MLPVSKRLKYIYILFVLNQFLSFPLFHHHSTHPQCTYLVSEHSFKNKRKKTIIPQACLKLFGSCLCRMPFCNMAPKDFQSQPCSNHHSVGLLPFYLVNHYPSATTTLDLDIFWRSHVVWGSKPLHLQALLPCKGLSHPSPIYLENSYQILQDTEQVLFLQSPRRPHSSLRWPHP